MLKSIGTRALSFAALVALPACAGPVAQSPPTLASSPVGGPTNEVTGARSWMAPEAKSEDLLYISDLYGVHIFSYPKGRHVGDISDFGEGLCSDQAGDVFLTNEPARTVDEYAHGGTQRLKTLYDNYVDFNPIDCSVDPTTGNVAVASADSNFVVVFPKATNDPQVYYDSYATMFYCAYDGKGDLFVDKVMNQTKNYIGELPVGTAQFKNYLLDQRITHSGGIQFDGKHVAIEDQGSHVVYQLRFSGSNALIVGRTPLNGTTWVAQYWIQGKMLIGPDSNYNVYFWKYPGGGSPVGHIEAFRLDYGSTASVNP